MHLGIVHQFTHAICISFKIYICDEVEPFRWRVHKLHICTVSTVSPHKKALGLSLLAICGACMLCQFPLGTLVSSNSPMTCKLVLNSMNVSANVTQGHICSKSAGIGSSFPARGIDASLQYCTFNCPLMRIISCCTFVYTIFIWLIFFSTLTSIYCICKMNR